MLCINTKIVQNQDDKYAQQILILLMLEWQNIPQDVIRRCVDSMRKRCQACILLEVDIQLTNPVPSA
jgi:hypothetical protein